MPTALPYSHLPTGKVAREGAQTARTQLDPEAGLSSPCTSLPPLLPLQSLLPDSCSGTGGPFAPSLLTSWGYPGEVSTPFPLSYSFWGIGGMLSWATGPLESDPFSPFPSLPLLPCLAPQSSPYSTSHHKRRPRIHAASFPHDSHSLTANVLKATSTARALLLLGADLDLCLTLGRAPDSPLGSLLPQIFRRTMCLLFLVPSSHSLLHILS